MNKKVLRSVLTLIIATIAVLCVPSRAYAKTVTIPNSQISFEIPDNCTSYYYKYISVNGDVKLTVTIDGKTKYYTVKNGKLVETDKNFKPLKPETKPANKKNGWYGKKYYIEGKVVKGWKVISGKKYYFNKKTGDVTTGLKKVGKHTYYFGKKGAMTKDKILKVDGKIRAFNKKGYMVTSASYTGKYKGKKVTYYFDKYGVAVWKAI